MRIVACNANRLRDSDLMRDVVEEMNRRKVHIVIWTETHFDQKHSIEFEKIAERKGYKTYSVTRLMKRYDSGSGGVTIMVCRRSVHSTSIVVEKEESGGSSGRDGEGHS